MTIDQTTGILYFVFYDRRNTSNNLTDVYMARSTDGGETFANFKVSESSFNPNSNVFLVITQISQLSIKWSIQFG